MLEIRTEQLEQMASLKDREFRERVELYLTRLPLPSDSACERAALRQLIDDCVDRGRQAGLRLETELLKFTELCYLHGPQHSFATNLQVKSIIQDQTYRPWQRLQQLELWFQGK